MSFLERKLVLLLGTACHRINTTIFIPTRDNESKMKNGLAILK